MSRLSRHGKPVRALKALREAGPHSLTEQDLWQRLSGHNGTFWHAPLKALVDLGYAERHGNRGGYSYTITAAGLGELWAMGVTTAEADAKFAKDER